MNDQRYKDLFRRRKKPLILFFILGLLVGVTFPILASLMDVASSGESVTFEHVWNRWLEIPNPIKLFAPLFLGTIIYSLARSNRKRHRQHAEFSEQILGYSQELESKNEKLKQLNDSLDGLIYSTSHELKTPIINLKSLLSMLKSVKDQPDSGPMMDDILGRMDESVLRFQETIDDMMDISRIEHDFKISSSPVGLKDAFQRVLDKLEKKISAEKAEIWLDLDPKHLVLIPPSGLEVIFEHLLTNALQFSHPDRPTVISIRSEEKKGEILLEIQDNGLGIDLAVYKDKIFRMFTRVSKASEGNGVGLYLIKRTMDLAGGKVEVESTLGDGSLFRLVFPAIKEMPDTAALA